MTWRRVLEDIARDIDAAEAALTSGEWAEEAVAWGPPDGLVELSPDDASEAAELLTRLRGVQLKVAASRDELVAEVKAGRDQLAAARSYSMSENLPRSS